MKAFLIITLVFILQISLRAQESDQKFIEFKQVINKINPEVDFNNKVIFISLWKSTDAESREINKEAYRVYKIYEKAKLKNGEKGTVFISLNLDTDEQIRAFAIGKDGLEESVIYTDLQVLEILRVHYNITNSQNTIVFDKTGTVQYTNIAKNDLFSSLRNLITR